MDTETYVSTDIESDGPIPGPNSMLSLGSAAFSTDKKIISTFQANLIELVGANGNPDTMAWWAKNPDAWKRARHNPCDPGETMVAYTNWVKGLPGAQVFVGYPTGYDFMFVYWYLIKFTGKSPFSFSALDIKTYAFAMLRKGYRESTKKGMPKRWFDPAPHTHVALDDAVEQGRLFCNMMKENNDKAAGIVSFLKELQGFINGCVSYGSYDCKKMAEEAEALKKILKGE